MERERLELGHQAKVFADFRKMGGGIIKFKKCSFFIFPVVLKNLHISLS